MKLVAVCHDVQYGIYAKELDWTEVAKEHQSLSNLKHWGAELKAWKLFRDRAAWAKLGVNELLKEDGYGNMVPKPLVAYHKQMATVRTKTTDINVLRQKTVIRAKYGENLIAFALETEVQDVWWIEYRARVKSVKQFQGQVW